MASTKLTDYERERLDNIRRNSQMMASLNIHAISTELESKSKKPSQTKRPRPDSNPIVVRRSLRTRGMVPDSNGLGDRFVEIAAKSPKCQMPSPRKLGPLTMREAYEGEGSARCLIEKIKRTAKESENTESNGGVGIRKAESSSVGEAKVCKAESSSFSVKKEENEVIDCKVESFSSSVNEERNGVSDSFDIFSMSLNPKNIVRIWSDRIMALRFFPCASSRMIVAGSKAGDVGFWNLDSNLDDEKEMDGVYRYHCHSGPVSGISIQPHCLTKVFTSGYDGFIRLMDAEKEVFDLIYSSEYPIYSIAQRSSDVKCLYFGEGWGGLSIWDERSKKCTTQWILHEDKINSVDFSSANPNLMATCSGDGTTCIWDLRSIDANKPTSLKKVYHKRTVHAAYFSPSGKFLATTSLDNTVGIHGGANFEKSSSIEHNNQTGRWISPFKAIWSWSDSEIFIGNMKRGVDVISPALKKTIFTLQSPILSAIPCRFDVHPYNIGMLAGATGGGQVYVWTLN